MKKLLSYALVAVLLISVLVSGPNPGLYVVDAVSAATGDDTAPAPAAASKAQTATEVASLLVEGSFGGEVALLQTMLNNNGYTLKVDGFFGQKTLAAVEDYQSKNGLKTDGIVGPKTLALLNPVAPAAPEVAAVEPEAVEPEAVEPVADAVSSASIVDNGAAFEKAISKDGTWIICTLNDLAIDKDLVLEGEFHDKNDPTKDLKRKIGLYTQDDDHNVTARFSLTAPSLTIKFKVVHL